MNKRTGLCCTALMMAFMGLTTSASRADSIPFSGTAVTDAYASFDFSTKLETNTSNDGTQFKLQIYDLGPSVGFRFSNAGSVGRIEEVYFYDGHLIQNGSIAGPDWVLLRDGSSSPGNLPGFNYSGLGVTRFYSADAAAPPDQGTGVAPGTYVDIKFDLKTGITLSRLMADLVGPSGTPFYIGIHVQDAEGSDSDTFLANPSTVSTPPPQVPLPGVVWAGIVLFGGVAVRRSLSGRKMPL